MLDAARLMMHDKQTRQAISINLEPDLAAALAAHGLVSLTEDEEAVARTVIVDGGNERIPPERAAVQSVALRWLLRQEARALPRRARVQDIVEMLAAIPHALKRWPWEEKPKTKGKRAIAQQWDIQNEYHVQSLLWAILAPVFPDLEDEEYLKSLGHKHPRVDLAIPSQSLIIEVKFVSGGTPAEFASVIGGVSQDTGLYLSIPSNLSQIIAFVWDNSRCTEQHVELLSGLRLLRGVTDAVVISRPGKWKTSTDSLSPSLASQ